MIVAFPATPLLLGRMRICLFASHTKEELVKALEENSSITFSSFLTVILVISVLILIDSYFLHVCIVATTRGEGMYKGGGGGGHPLENF